MEQLINYDQILKGFKMHTAQDVPMKGWQAATVSSLAAVPNPGETTSMLSVTGVMKKKSARGLGCEAV